MNCRACITGRHASTKPIPDLGTPRWSVTLACYALSRQPSRPVHKPSNQPVSRSVSWPGSQAACQAARQAASQPARHPTSQRQTVIQPGCHPASQPAQPKIPRASGHIVAKTIRKTKTTKKNKVSSKMRAPPTDIVLESLFF